MRTIALQILLIQSLLCFISCEKDFIDDEDCITYRGGNSIPPWSEAKDTADVSREDTIRGAFAISVDEWGDTIQKNIPIQ